MTIKTYKKKSWGKKEPIFDLKLYSQKHLVLRCVICNAQMTDPKVDTQICGKEECRKKYHAYTAKIWKIKNQFKTTKSKNKRLKKKKAL